MVDTPVKKINFGIAEKENLPFGVPNASDVAVGDNKKPAVEEVKKPFVAPTLRPEEADEPLLQENPNRFVLFPIKYHEVRIASTRHA